jgi:hypothetical protein
VQARIRWRVLPTSAWLPEARIERHTIGRSLGAAVLLAANLDHHLLEAGHDGGRSKVSEIRHSVARAESEGAIGVGRAIVVVLPYVTGGGRVGALRHGRYGWLQCWAYELRVNWLLKLLRRRIALFVCGFLGVFGLARSGAVAVVVVVAIAGAFVLVVCACRAYRSFARAARLLAPTCQASCVDPAPLRIRSFVVIYKANRLWLRRNSSGSGSSSMRRSCGSTLIHGRIEWGQGEDRSWQDGHMGMEAEA